MKTKNGEQTSGDIHLLGDVLGRVIRRQAGVDVFELEERIRALSKARRTDDDPAGDEAIERLVTGMSLVTDETVRQTIYNQIESAFHQTSDWILRVTGQREILENEPVLQRSVRRRNPYVDPLNTIQVNLLRRPTARKGSKSCKPSS
jgi:phosphoenolpyruvate carboxylase